MGFALIESGAIEALLSLLSQGASLAQEIPGGAGARVHAIETLKYLEDDAEAGRGERHWAAHADHLAAFELHRALRRPAQPVADDAYAVIVCAYPLPNAPIGKLEALVVWLMGVGAAQMYASSRLCTTGTSSAQSTKIAARKVIGQVNARHHARRVEEVQVPTTP